MPMPIVPIHQQESMPILFGQSSQPEFMLSEVQAALFAQINTDNRKTKTSANVIGALMEIDKHTDLIVTAVSNSNDRICSVPPTIDEQTLLALKADGLIQGYGRSVKITDRGKTALRDHYLSSVNAMKENKISDKFDYRSFSRIASKEKNEN